MKRLGATLALLLGGVSLAQTNLPHKIGNRTEAEGQFRSLGAPTSGSGNINRSGKNYLLTIHGPKIQPAPNLEVWLYKGGIEGASKNVQVEGKYLTLGTVKRFDSDFTFTIVS